MSMLNQRAIEIHNALSVLAESPQPEAHAFLNTFITSDRFRWVAPELPDPERLAAADAKRARKNAARLKGLNS